MSLSKAIRRKRNMIIRLSKCQDDLCFYCDKPMILPSLGDKSYGYNDRQGPDEASQDHVLPKSDGGANNGFNIVIAHRDCNTKRNKRILNEEQTKKLGLLNEKRQHLFTSEHGKLSPTTFGVVTAASITLSELLDEEDRKIQRAVLSRLSRFCYDVKQLRCIKDSRVFITVLNLLTKEYIARIKESNVPHKTYILSLLSTIKKENIRERMRIPK